MSFLFLVWLFAVVLGYASTRYGFDPSAYYAAALVVLAVHSAAYTILLEIEKKNAASDKREGK